MSLPFSAKKRTEYLEILTASTFDLLIIGGGITGAGIALDAALRGMKVALIEQADFASGTSSRSTKLIHGGLRYLKQFEIKLVSDVGRERAIVYRNARHLVIPEKMLLPIVKDGTLGTFTSSIGLSVYDLLAGVKKEEWRKMLNQKDTLKAEPLLRANNLVAGGLYFEYRTDDARLVIENLKSANANGAVCLNYAAATDFIYETGKVCGLKIEDKLTGKHHTIRAQTIVNAAGPWVDIIRKADNSLHGKKLQLTKGVHLVFDYAKLPLQQAVYFDVQGGRMIFAIPRDGITYVGTTDTVYSNQIDSPHTTQADAQYLIAACNHIFHLNLTINDIQSSWAGLRPLIYEEGKSASELSRKDEIIISDSGLLSIAGGKLTGYRLMAEKIVNLVAKKQQQTNKKIIPKCTTKEFRISGGEFANQEAFEQFEAYILSNSKYAAIPTEIKQHLIHRYGTNVASILNNSSIETNYSLENLLKVDADYCVENEMICRTTDFFIRRTGNIFFHRPQTQPFLETINTYLAEKLNWNEEQKVKNLEEVLAAYKDAVTFA